jgi:hypothetical protein
MDAFTESVLYKAFVNIKQSTSTWSKVTEGEKDVQANQSRFLLTAREGNKQTGTPECIWMQIKSKQVICARHLMK